MTMKTQAQPTKITSPWSYIPTLYFASAIPYVIINQVSTIFYKRMGVDNQQIAFWTSLLSLPWVIKMFWGPLVDLNSTKRSWIVSTQFAMGCCLAWAAFYLNVPNFFFLSLAILGIGAFISATYDIAADGFYLLALNHEQQAFFVGIRNLFYRLGMIFCFGFLVVFAGRLEKSLNNIPLSWTITLSLTALILGLLFIYHRIKLPSPELQRLRRSKLPEDKIPWKEVFTSYFRQEKIGFILAFILLYRFGEAMMLKLASLFFLDKVDIGGLGLTTEDVGLVYGTFGVISLIAGGILGGLVIVKYGLKKCLFPMALALNVPDLFYVYMAYVKPSLNLVYPMVSLEQFGYGFGFTAFSVYLMYVSQGQYKTSHYAISTGIMALGVMIPGALSGFIQKAVGYPMFFVIVCLATIPGMISLLFIPLPGERGEVEA